MKVAVLGTGRMGKAMATRLAGAGLEVILWNRTRATAEDLAAEIGARLASSPADAAREATVVVASLADDAALEAVHGGDDGTAAGVGPDTVVVETSTVDPQTIVSLAASLEATGARLIDAPVSGSVTLVEQGALTVMAGGSTAALAIARPVLDVLAAKVFHLGASGAGATMKLAVNALVHATNLAISEALVLAEAAGIARRDAYEVFASGAAGSPFVLYKREAFERPDEAPVAFSLDLVAKDLDLILGLADRLDVDLAQGEVTATVTNRAIEAGLGGADMSAIAVHLRQSRPNQS